MNAAPEPEPGNSVLGLARGIGVTFGGSALLLAGTLAAGLATARALRARRRPPLPALLGLAAAIAYEAGPAPWMRSWGSTPEERRRALPGDELVPEPGLIVTHAITIDAPAEAVWPWVAQIGQDRGGFYSYEWLENLAGCEIRNADRVHPEWQQRQIGEPVPLFPGTPGLPVTVFEPGRALGLEGWGLLLVEPAGAGRSRLIVRGRIARGAATAFYLTLLEIPHFVMERQMLLGIKRRAEAAALRPPAGD